MSKLKYSPQKQILLDGCKNANRYDVASFTDSLTSGYIPNNFVELISRTSSFKDAFLNHVVNNCASHEYEVIEKALTLGVEGTDGESVTAYAECLASLAYAFGNTELAMAAITRIQPNTASGFIKSTAQALNKDMPPAVYKTMVANSTQTSNQIWETVEKPARYPNA